MANTTHEREVVLDEPTLFDEQAEAVRKATDRAERAEAELAKLKHTAAHQPAASHKATASPVASATDDASLKTAAYTQHSRRPGTRNRRRRG